MNDTQGQLPGAAAPDSFPCAELPHSRRDATGRERGQWILRPLVLRIAAAQLLAYLEVGRAPETREIARDLHWTTRGREQMQSQWDATTTHARRVLESEQLLQPNGEYR